MFIPISREFILLVSAPTCSMAIGFGNIERYFWDGLGFFWALGPFSGRKLFKLGSEQLNKHKMSWGDQFKQLKRESAQYSRSMDILSVNTDDNVQAVVQVLQKMAGDGVSHDVGHEVSRKAQPSSSNARKRDGFELLLFELIEAVWDSQLDFLKAQRYNHPVGHLGQKIA